MGLSVNQEKAVNAKGNILVSAAAGSGKTYVLTERVVKLLSDTDNEISADSLLIVTFTKAAAAEMKSRISKRLAEECRAHPENLHLKEQNLLLSTAKICTIDSFCIDLLKSNFQHLGISPQFSVADENDLSALKFEIMSKTLSRFYANPDETFDKLSTLCGNYSNSLESMLLGLYEKSCSMPFPEIWLKKLKDSYNYKNINENIFVNLLFEKATNILVDALEKANQFLFEIQPFADSDYFVSANDCVLNISTLLEYAKEKKWDLLYNGCLNFQKPFTISKKKSLTEINDYVKTVNDDLFKNITSIANSMCCSFDAVSESLKEQSLLVEKISEILLEFNDKLNEKMLENNSFSFSAIEQLALKLLCEYQNDSVVPSRISKDICAQYSNVLVDEYQDTNSLQDALYYAISDCGKNLFMVGDVKQSIYGFRNANPENFLNKKENYPEYLGDNSPAKIFLSSNYRSRDGVCDYINFFFENIMTDSTCMNYGKDDRLIPAAEFPKTVEAPCEVHVIDDKSMLEDKNVTEATYIAEYILKSVGNILVTDKNSKRLRRAEFKDFAIICRSLSSKLNDYSTVFKKYGIPLSGGGDEFFETVEITTIISLLKVINNPTIDIDLVAAMHSPVFCFTAEELAEIKTNFKAESFYASVILASKNNKKAADFVKLIFDLQTISTTLTPAELVLEVYNKTSFLEIMASVDSSNTKLKNLNEFYLIAQNFSNNSNDLSDFIKHINNFSNFKKFSEGSVSAKNAVSIMTIHKSKGLQFPICILADTAKLFNQMDMRSRIITNLNYGIGMKYPVSTFSLVDTISRTALIYAEHKKSIAEEIRLWYVAMTRAEEKIIFTVCDKKFEKTVSKIASKIGSNKALSTESILNAKSPLEWLVLTSLLHPCGQPLSEFANINHSPISTSNANFKFVFGSIENFGNASIEKEELTASKNSELLKQIKNQLDYKYPFVEATVTKAKITASNATGKSSNDVSFTELPQFMSKDGLTPAQRGTANHQFMQFADYNAAIMNLEGEIERLVEYEYITEIQADALQRNSLQKFLNSQLLKRILNSSNYIREHKFMVYDDSTNERIIVQGCADCVFFEDGKIIVVDFKTDLCKSAIELVEKYSSQLEIYANAMSKIYNLPIKEKIIYSLHLSEAISFN